MLDFYDNNTNKKTQCLLLFLGFYQFVEFYSNTVNRTKVRLQPGPWAPLASIIWSNLCPKLIQVQI